jgi:hypothetical protein
LVGLSNTQKRRRKKLNEAGSILYSAQIFILSSISIDSSILPSIQATGVIMSLIRKGPCEKEKKALDLFLLLHLSLFDCLMSLYRRKTISSYTQCIEDGHLETDGPFGFLSSSFFTGRSFFSSIQTVVGGGPLEWQTCSTSGVLERKKDIFLFFCL